MYVQDGSLCCDAQDENVTCEIIENDESKLYLYIMIQL